MAIDKYSRSNEASFLFQKNIYYGFLYGAISFILVLVALLLVYVTCSKKYRLNWFEKNLLERASKVDPSYSQDEYLSIATESEIGSSRSLANLVNEDKFWVPLNHAKNHGGSNEKECSGDESTAALPGSRSSLVSFSGEEINEKEAQPIARNDKQVVLCTTKPARPRVCSMNTKLDHTKIDSTLYQEVSRSPSVDDLRGSVNLSMSYDHAAGILSVRLIQAKDLMPRDFSGTSDPYAKIRLLPDCKNVWQTRIHKKTINPVFDEDFVFEVPSTSLDRRTLEIILYDFDAYSRHLSLGEVRLPLSQFDFTEKITMWKPLEPCSEPHEKLGRRFGRPDKERCDLFADLGFLDWGPYTGQIGFGSALKGLQMLAGGPDGGPKKCGIQQLSGYFEKEFISLNVNDPYKEMWKFEGRPKVDPSKAPWIPVTPAHKHCSPGDYFGTFIKDMEAFSPLLKPIFEKKPKELKNFLTNPPKKGNCGYVDICINKYPPHTIGGKTDTYVAAEEIYRSNWEKHKAKITDGPFKAGFYPQPYFDPNPYVDSVIGPTYIPPKENFKKIGTGIFYPPATPKRPGNNHDGCFSKFTKWVPEPYMTAEEAQKLQTKKVDPKLIWAPPAGSRAHYIKSVVNNKVNIACNERTWRTMKPITYPQFNT